MFRRLLLATLVAVTAITLSPAAAQVAASTRPGLGVETTLYSLQGDAYATISVLMIAEPFEAYDFAQSPPARDYHWVMVNVRFTLLVGSIANDYRPGFALGDRDGYRSLNERIQRSEVSMENSPDFSNAGLLAGESSQGVVLFQLYNDSEIAIIEYSPDQFKNQGSLDHYHSTVILDLQDQVAGLCSGVVWHADDGAPIAAFTANGIVDPITGYQTSTLPARGRRFVGVIISVANLSTDQIYVSEYGFAVVDTWGAVIDVARVEREEASTALLPTFSSRPLDPGATVTGLLAFELSKETSVEALTFSPHLDPSRREFQDRTLRLLSFESADARSAVMVTLVPGEALDTACD
jgi:Domain of unknown function (DUF4352)